MTEFVACERCGAEDFGLEMRWVKNELKIVPVCKNCLKPIVETRQKSEEEEE